MMGDLTDTTVTQSDPTEAVTANMERLSIDNRDNSDGSASPSALHGFVDAMVTYLLADRSVRLTHCQVRQTVMDNTYRLGFTPHRVQGVGSRYEGFPGEVCGPGDTLETNRDFPVVVCEPLNEHIETLRHKFGYVTAAEVERCPGYAWLRTPHEKIPRFVCTAHEGEFYLNSEAFSHRATRTRHSSGEGTRRRSPIKSTTCALLCPIWPPGAADFLSRPRPSGWPSRPLIDKIQRAGCHLVPESGPKSHHRDLAWKWVFSVAERELIHDLSDSMVGAIFVLKSISRQMGVHFSLMSFPNNYCIKTACLWVFESASVGKNCSSSLVICAKVLDWLIEAFRGGELAHYFMPSRNLIAHLSGEELSHVTEELLSAKTNMWKLALKALDVTSHLPGLVQDVKRSLPTAAASSGSMETIIDKLASFDSDTTDVLQRATNCIQSGGDVYKLKRRLAYAMWSEANFHVEIFEVVFHQIEQGVSLADVIATPEHVIKPLLVDLKSAGPLGGMYRCVLHRFLGEIYHNLCFAISEGDSKMRSSSDSSALNTCLDKCISYYHLGAEMIYPDGWSDRRLGGLVLIAKHHWLRKEWDKLKENTEKLHPLLTSALQSPEHLNSMGKISVWRHFNNDDGWKFEGLNGDVQQEMSGESFIPFHSVPLGIYLELMRVNQTKQRKDSSFSADDLTACASQLWDPSLVTTTNLLSESCRKQ